MNVFILEVFLLPLVQFTTQISRLFLWICIFMSNCAVLFHPGTELKTFSIICVPFCIGFNIPCYSLYSNEHYLNNMKCDVLTSCLNTYFSYSKLFLVLVFKSGSKKKKKLSANLKSAPFKLELAKILGLKVWSSKQHVT